MNDRRMKSQERFGELILRVARRLPPAATSM
jgi:hypothetical protein